MCGRVPIKKNSFIKPGSQFADPRFRPFTFNVIYVIINMVAIYFSTCPICFVPFSLFFSPLLDCVLFNDSLLSPCWFICCTIASPVWTSKTIPSLSLASGGLLTCMQWPAFSWWLEEDLLQLSRVLSPSSLRLPGTLPWELYPPWPPYIPSSVSLVKGDFHAWVLPSCASLETLQAPTVLHLLVSHLLEITFLSWYPMSSQLFFHIFCSAFSFHCFRLEG